MNKKTSTNITAIGLVILVGANVIAGAISENGGGGSEAIQAVGLVGGVAYIVGLCLLARAKNRCWAWGLTGLLCVVGGISVVMLKEKIE